ncbi:cilia- and flagella-associated protein 61 [Drosophila grimshawi]|uniref:GH19778 n=1 Tax=Drosophila grimshawi TaxID=7222 RepID=B4J425_DROGR|nr:cilia- and flagella-associated protein 61 [Drosophila grimshawi]EDW02631.1 GH19778 [Drosophila grimshawi]
MSLRYTVRRAIQNDVDSISSLVNADKIYGFGNKRPKFQEGQIFKQYQTHRMVVELNESSDSTLIAYAEFRNYPAIGPLPSDSWLEWLHKKYCITVNLSSLNSLFFNFCLYRCEHPDALLALLQEVFYVESRVLYLITVKTPIVPDNKHYAECFDDLKKYAMVFYPREFSITSNPNTQSVYITDRIRLLPKITYRKALPEDNDDIIEIHEYEMPEIRDKLGDFYIADELLRTDENAKNRVLIVAEVQNELQESYTAGFIWLDSDVDIRFYVRNYEMETFGNLIKFDKKKPYNSELINVKSVEPRPEAYLFTADAMDDLDAITIIGGVQFNDSGTSVASLGKLRVSSNRGTIVDTKVATSQDKFYMHEDLYLKFDLIFEKLIMASYYINEQMKRITLFYNTNSKNPQKDHIQAASNVFSLKCICVHKDFPLERLFNCLAAMYSAFPDRDYCIMTIPKSLESLRSHGEALKYFVPVAQRPSEEVNLDEIYITHRSTFFGEICMYRLEKDDADRILNLAMSGHTFSEVKTVSPASSFSFNPKADAFINIDHELQVIKHIITEVLDNESSEYDVFTIRCGDSNKSAKENTAIGFVILRKFLNHHELYFHYHLPKNDNHLNNQRAEIISLKLHPLFNDSSDVIFRILAAKTNYCDFYFIVARVKYLFSNDLKSMMMVIEPNPMKKIYFPPTEVRSRERLSDLEDHDYYNDDLIIFRHKLNPTKWFGQPNKLVIIGFTPVAKAFLRQLVFHWNSKDHVNSENFTCLPRLQVIVIAAPGVVEADYDCMFQCPYCDNMGECYLHHQQSCCYVRDVLVRIDLRLWVHFVIGRVNYVNREKKYVKINKSCEIYYDTLLLMNYLNHCLKTEQVIHHSGRLPSNFVEINNRLDKFILFYKLRVLLEKHARNHHILIYGGNLQTYECISFLMSHGVAPERVILVIPYRKVGTQEQQKLKNPYYDRNIQHVLDDMLNDCKIQTHSDLIFSHWMQHGTANFILEVVFTKFSSKKVFKCDCDIFISFDEGNMDTYTKEWLMESEITLSGSKILVNKEFQTNDPDIYAAGTFIEIKDYLNHQYQYVSERETAIKLMHILKLNASDTFFEDKYSQPTFFKALLPLGYFIFKVTMPCRYLASKIIGCSSYTLTSYHKNTFCRIGLTSKMIVDEIVIVTKEDQDFDYLEHFCGKHESMLNNLKARHQNGQIKCLMRFLREPWTELLMHDDFNDFQVENHRMLLPMIKGLDINKRCFKELLIVNQRVLEENLLEFIRKNRRDFHHDFALPEDYVTMDRFSGTCGSSKI